MTPTDQGHQHEARETQGRMSMAGLKGTRFEDFIIAAKKRAEDAIEQHKPRLTTLEKSLRDAAIRRRNNESRGNPH